MTQTAPILWQPRMAVGMNGQQLEQQREMLRSALKELDSIKTTCEWCQHMQVLHCKKFEQEPPAKFRKTEGACESWAYDAIPY